MIGTELANGNFIHYVNKLRLRKSLLNTVKEKRLITIAGDKGTAIESRDNIEYIVNNRGWSD